MEGHARPDRIEPDASSPPSRPETHHSIDKPGVMKGGRLRAANWNTSRVSTPERNARSEEPKAFTDPPPSLAADWLESNVSSLLESGLGRKELTRRVKQLVLDERLRHVHLGPDPTATSRELALRDELADTSVEALWVKIRELLEREYGYKAEVASKHLESDRLLGQAAHAARRREYKTWAMLGLLGATAGGALAAGVYADNTVFWAVVAAVFFMSAAGVIAYAAHGLGIFAELAELVSLRLRPKQLEEAHE